MAIHLQLQTTDKIDTSICCAYWSYDDRQRVARSLNDLQNHFNKTPGEIRSIVYKSCVAIARDVACDGCGISPTLKNRTHYASITKGSWRCDTCIESERRKMYLIDKEVIDCQFKMILDEAPYVDELSPTLKMQLLALLHHNREQPDGRIEAFHTDRPLAPSFDATDRKILDELVNNKVIFIHPDTAKSCGHGDNKVQLVNVDIENGTISVNTDHLGKLTYQISAKMKAREYLSVQEAFDLLNKEIFSSNFLIKNRHTIENYFRAIVRNELLDFVWHYFEEIGIQLEHNHCLGLTVDKLLGEISPLQVLTLLKRACSSSGRTFHHCGHTSSPCHLLHNVNPDVMRYWDYYQAEGVDVPYSAYPDELQQSSLSCVMLKESSVAHTRRGSYVYAQVNFHRAPFPVAIKSFFSKSLSSSHVAVDKENSTDSIRSGPGKDYPYPR